MAGFCVRRRENVMSVATRHRLGWILVAVSVAAALAVPLLVGAPVKERTFGESEVTVGPIHIIATPAVTWICSLQFSVPILLCGIAGLLCLLWPTRRAL
jgi:hypothetical protein